MHDDLHPQQIVSLQPSATVTLAALGCLDRVVACTKYCRDVVPARCSTSPASQFLNRPYSSSEERIARPLVIWPVRLFVHFLGSSGLLALSECPRCAQSLCCSGVIWVGVSPAGTELHRIVSSNPGAEKMKVRLIGSVPMFFKLIHVFAGMNTSPPAWRSRS